MKNSSISYIIAFFLCSLACHATVVLPNKTRQPLLSVSQQQTYKVSGTVIDAKTHTIIPEAIILLKNLTTGQENTYSCDQIWHLYGRPRRETELPATGNCEGVCLL